MNLPSEYQDLAEGHESIKAKVNAIRGKLVQQVRKHFSLLSSEELQVFGEVVT